MVFKGKNTLSNNMTKTQSIIAIPAIALTLLAGGALAGYATLASAQSEGAGSGKAMLGQMGKRGPHVHGDVTAVNGTMITVADERSGTTFSVDASSAIFKKMSEGAAPTTVTIAEIAVGDEISARGTISGTTLTATHVMEGESMGMGRGMGKGQGRHGDGVMGTVSSVNGSVITLQGRDGQTYTVNAGNTSVQKMVAGSLTDVQVGDMIGVHGTKDGTTVTATEIMTDVPARAAAQM